MCAGDLAKRIVEAHDPRERLVCSRCGFIFYIDPKVAVGTIVRGDAGFLLLRRSIEPGYGKWTFPGGYVDRGETLEQAAIRETLEETGVTVKLGRLLKVYSYSHRSIIMCVYDAEAVGGSARVTPEALDVRWCSPSEIPWRELAFPSTRASFHDYFHANGFGAFVPADLDPGEEF
jgi:mutator protein MutT